ncbi:MAG: formate dehydrogenase accessory protein FdhE [Actinomycetota bacterium]|nr:formate dehydrogenase accessory protein FdhE [Actinomycetota bacterium]
MTRTARSYVASNPRLKGVMGLYREVFSVQRRLSQRIPDRLPHLEEQQAHKLIEEGKPLIETGEMAVDVALAEELMRELAEVLRKKSESSLENLDAFLSRELDGEGLRALIEAFLERDDEEFLRLAEGYSLEPAVLYMLVHMTMAPFFWKAAGAIARKADLDQVPRGRCPVCGDLPIMGFLRSQDGLRVLECSLCGSRWGIPRIMCPFCMNVDQGKLKYIFVEGDDRKRAYLCEKCGRYLKVSTAPGERDEEFVIPLEDLATAHLDLAAEEKGYERGCRTVFS